MSESRVPARTAIITGLLFAVCLACVAAGEEDSRVEERQRMVEQQIAARGIDDPEVLAAMREVPRHLFIPPQWRGQAYLDRPAPIGDGQTISQPYIVALMTDLLELEPDDRVLEIGTGSGYHAAVMSRVAGRVYSIEIIEKLAEHAKTALDRVGYDNVEIRVGDGYRGWPEEAPFDAVILTAAPPEIPQPLIDQLAVGGRLVAPVGDVFQDLRVLEKTADGVLTESVAPVRFVPMVGEAQKKPE